MARCPKCGIPVGDDAYKCGVCGCDIIDGITDGSKGGDKPRGFNFGAFVFGGIWALAHGLWAVGLIGLFLYCVPGVNILFALWLGFAGNKMAWNRSSRKDLRLFRIEQWAWGVAGLLFVGLLAFAAFKLYEKFSYNDSDRFVTCRDRLLSVQDGERRYFEVHGEYTKNMNFLDYYLIADCNESLGCGGKVAQKISESCDNAKLIIGPGGSTQSFLVSGVSKAKKTKGCAICAGSGLPANPSSYKMCADNKTSEQRCDEIIQSLR